MTIDELKNKKSGLISETRSMLENVKSECRQMSDQEQQIFDNNLKEIEVLKSQIEKLQDQLLEVALEKKETVDQKPEEAQEKSEETVEETQPTENEEVNKDDEEETLEDETQTTDNEDVNENTEEVNEGTDETPVNEENTQDEDSDKNKNKRNLNHNIMSRKLLQQEIRSAMENGSNKLNISFENRALTVTGEGGVRDSVIETEYKNFIEPLYSESIIAKMGCTIYQGMPQADIKIPIMTAANAGFVDEIGSAMETKNGFDYILLQPHRFSCVYPISKQLLAQDTLNVEDLIYKNLYKTIASKIQKVFLGNEASSATQPAGIFNGVTATNISSYEELCDAEAKVDDSNVGLDGLKYIMSNKAKAVVRGMIRGTNNTGMVWEHNEIDGAPVLANSDIAGQGYAFGDFSKIYFATFGDGVELTIDPFTLSHLGQVRIIANMYVDWKKATDSTALRDENFIVYGNITRE